MSPGQLRTLAMAAVGEADRKDQLRFEVRALEISLSLARIHDVRPYVRAEAALLIRAEFLDVKPCPCCGQAGPYRGPLSALRYGVKCMGLNGEGISGCGLQIGREIGDDPAMDDWFALNLAVTGWNARTA